MLLPCLLFVLDLAFFTIFQCMQPRVQPRSLIANGSNMMYGTLPSGLMWQSSGWVAVAVMHILILFLNNCGTLHSVLYSGGCYPKNQSIKDCFELDLVGDPNEQLDPNHLNSPRQRVEFRSHEGVEG